MLSDLNTVFVNDQMVDLKSSDLEMLKNQLIDVRKMRLEKLKDIADIVEKIR